MTTAPGWLGWIVSGAALAGLGMYFAWKRLQRCQRLLADAHAELQRARARWDERHAAETHRTSALADAERLARTRSEFLGQLSHELRTPLNGIMGFAQILLADQSLTTRQSRGLNMIRDSGQQLLNLINDILDLARIDAGTLELATAGVALPSFLAAIADRARSKADEKKLAFRFEPVGLPPAVFVDEVRLRQVLQNLLSNAIEFTDHGHVGLRVEALAAAAAQTVRLRFDVRDSGQGERAGLGLAISRQLVQLMGGTIDVRSEPGHGSVFSVELVVPLPAGDSRTVSARVAADVHGYEGPRKTVLVADDAAHHRSRLVDNLSLLGFEVAEAANGQQLIERARDLRPDLIVMDLALPLIDGLEATRLIRLVPGLAHVPIIATSTNAADDTAAAALAAGVDAFVPKPIDQQALLQALERHLGVRWIDHSRSIDAAPSLAAAHADDGEMIVPPREELQGLLVLAQIGNMRDIRERANYLDRLDARYGVFAERLRELAGNYESQAIVALVERYCTH